MENENKNANESTAEAVQDKVEIKFTGSENLRAKFPKAFDVAEAVATDWKNDGNFEKIPLGHPTAEAFASHGLKKAKEIEKKVVNSPAVEQFAMKALTLGLKAQGEFQKIREQVKAKMKK